MKHVAIVEDEPDIRANYRTALERQQYRVSDYPDRPSALAAFGSGSIGRSVRAK